MGGWQHPQNPQSNLPQLGKEKSAFDEDECELDSDIDGDVLDNPTSALKFQQEGQNMKNLSQVNKVQEEQKLEISSFA